MLLDLKINMEEYKVLITTSGIGSRLGELTNYTNKSLIRVGKKPAISYIIEKYPKNIEFIITVGYYGNQVIEFLKLAYPDRNFTFVEVDKYSGEGSSLAYSLLCAKNELQCPFIFHASDTIIFNEINEPTHNWLGSSYKKDASQYRTISFVQSNMIYDKGEIDSNYAYIGLLGINDYKNFWESLEYEYKSDPNNQSLSDCNAINRMIVDKWEVYNYDDWLDIGNAFELTHARNIISDKFELLDKVDESIFLFDDFVIKFFYNKNICKNRVDRCNELQGLTPKLIDYTENFYKYEYAKGELFSKCVNEKTFKNFLKWSLKNLWLSKGQSEDFKKICEDFYINKTIKRLNEFYKKYSFNDETMIINGYIVPPINEMLSNIDKDWLYSDTFYQFHGDYILDNIIYESNDNFILLDWRQDFGGDLKNGDIYYDLSKLNHNLLFNHDIIHAGHYEVIEKNNEIRIDIFRSDILTNCREILHEFIKANNFDLKKVNILTAIIWLNMSPLHEPKMGKFLFYLGKLNLYKSLYIK